MLADEFKFRVATLQHGLEAYKIAPEIAKRGTGVSIFADSWGYKLEAYDSIPYNAYILWKNGVNGLDQLRLGRADASTKPRRREGDEVRRRS